MPIRLWSGCDPRGILPASVVTASAMPSSSAHSGDRDACSVDREASPVVIPLSRLLAELEVGFEEIDDGLWNVYFGPAPLRLGRFSERTSRIHDDRGRLRRRRPRRV
jgi:hypothetical protein